MARREGNFGWRPVAAAAFALALATAAPAQVSAPGSEDAFRQVEPVPLPPSAYRAASGAPTAAYWQQKVDYRIAATVDEAARSIAGQAEVTYHNHSPEELRYLWFALDANGHQRGSIAERTRTADPSATVAEDAARALHLQARDGGFSDVSVTDAHGQRLPARIVDTLMKVDLPSPLQPGQSVTLNMSWNVALIETAVIGGRDGYECFGSAASANCILLAGQWFPKALAYSDYDGWHTRFFLGDGEFALEFGDYEVALTVPADHVVAATGELANAAAVLTAEQRQRLARARTSDTPVYIVTPDEAAAAERSHMAGTKTWHFAARNVRDFAFASSRKFIWDAMGVRQPGTASDVVMAMSFFPREASPLWDAESTKAIAKAIEVYGRRVFPYPYPTAQAVNGPVDGMEYPMLTFNDPRPRSDGSVGQVSAAGPKNSLIGINMHEIGHIWFSMIVNSDERRWAWLDEGVNSLVQHLAEKEWDPAFLTRLGGEPKKIIPFMRRTDRRPLMTQADSQNHYFEASYQQAATALAILRTTVLGPDVFDQALLEYGRRWRFRRPTPYDFFRTFEDSSGVDLDWFWRGWFYGTGHVDIALDRIVALPSNATGTTFHRFDFRNVGGIVMPVPLRIEYADGTSEIIRIPAEIWRMNDAQVSWQFASDKPVVGAEVDPARETSDVDTANNRAAIGGVTKKDQR